MSSTVCNSGIHLQDGILDPDATSSTSQKIECIKLLKVVVKNLADPAKCEDSKYRQLRLSNEKVEQKLLPCPSAISYLEAIGFTKIEEDDGSRYIRIVESSKVDTNQMEKSLLELSNALEILNSKNITSPSGRKASFAEEKKTSEGSFASTGTHNTTKMSEKQKARLLMERKRQREADEAKAARAKNIAMLKQDKYVRKHDTNWKSGVSAACAKSGEGISTFRDKYGEN